MSRAERAADVGSGEQAAPAGGQITIGSIRISDVDAATADRLGPALKRALSDALANGKLSPLSRHSLRLNLPHGATEADITAALIRALGRQ